MTKLGAGESLDRSQCLRPTMGSSRALVAMFTFIPPLHNFSCPALSSSLPSSFPIDSAEEGRTLSEMWTVWVGKERGLGAKLSSGCKWKSFMSLRFHVCHLFPVFEVAKLKPE